MAGAIKGSDIIQDNHLANAISQAEKFLDLQRQINEMLRERAKLLKATESSAGGSTSKKIKESNEQLTIAKKLKKEQDDLNKKLAKSERTLVEAYSLENKQIIAVREATKTRNKQIKDQIKLTKAADGSIVQMRAKLSKLTSTYDNLTRVQRENSNVGGKQVTTIRKLRDEILKLEKATGRSQRDVGNYSKALKNGAAQARNLASALGAVGGIMLFARTIRDAFNVILEFDAAQANLAAITGKSIEELSGLTAEAKELGAVTKFTASQVSELQLELAKLGFTAKQISDATPDILDLAAALGVDLARAAKLAGATVRAFGLSTEDTGRVTNVLTAAANKSALSFEFLESAMATIAPVANAFGFSVEETTALLGTLANSGFDASSAATATRNILLNLADANGALAKSLGGPVKNLPDLVAGLKELQASGVDLADSLALTDKRSVAAFQTFLNNADAAQELSESITGTTAASEAAEKQMDSLQGSLLLLRSAWEGYILKAGDAGGVSDKLKKIVKFLADNLGVILDTLLAVGKAFIIYKTALFATTIATKLFGKTSILATKGVKGLGAAIRGIPFVQVAVAVVALIPLVLDLFDAFTKTRVEAEELTLAQETLNKVAEETEAQLAKESAELFAVFENLKLTTAGTKERQEALDVVNEKYGLTLQNLEDEAAFVRQVDAAYQDLIATLETKIKQDVIRAEITQLLTERFAIERDIARQISEADAAAAQNLALGGDPDFITAQQQLLNFSQGRLVDIQNAIAALKGLAGELDVFGADLDPDKKGLDLGAKAKKKKDPKTQADLDRQRFADVRKQNKDNLLAIEKDLRASGSTQEEIQQGIADARLKDLQQELALALKLFGEYSDEFIASSVRLNREVDKQNPILKQVEQNKQLYADLQQQNSENLKILEAQMLESGKSQSFIQEELNRERLKGLQDTADKALELFNAESREFIDANLALQKELARQRDKELEERKKMQKELNKLTQDNLKFLAEQIGKSIQNIEDQISKIREQIGMGDTRIDQLKELAREGNLEAGESIKAEEAKNAKLEKDIRELERKKNNLLILTTLLLAAQQGLEAGDSNAFGNAESNVGSLLGSAKKFEKGTEDTGSGGNVDGKGGFWAIMHPHERVLTKEDNAKLIGKGMSNDDVTAGAIAWNDYLSTAPSESFGSYKSIAMLGQVVDGISKLEQAIKDQPETRRYWDADEKAIVEITSRPSGKVSKYKRYIRP